MSETVAGELSGIVYCEIRRPKILQLFLRWPDAPTKTKPINLI